MVWQEKVLHNNAKNNVEGKRIANEKAIGILFLEIITDASELSANWYIEYKFRGVKLHLGILKYLD